MGEGIERKLLFITLSLLIHLVALLIAGYLTGISEPLEKLIKKATKKKERVVYVKILDMPKPKKKETPKEKNTPIISQFTTRKKGPLGKQEKSMLSGSSPVLKPQWGLPIKVAPAPAPESKEKSKKEAILKEKKGKNNKSTQPKKKARPKKEQKAKRAKASKGKKKKKASQQKKTKVKIETKIVKKPLPPLPKRKIPLIDPRLISKESKKIVPQMGEGESVEISLDTTESKYISYFKHIRDKIYLVWRYPREAAMAGISGVVRILFVIGRDGYLKEVRILESSGYTVLDKAAVNAIYAAAPFGPFPKDWTEKELRIRARFIYTLYRRSPF